MNQSKISNAIDEICSEGCTSVNEIITALEKQQQIKHTQHLNSDEVSEVLDTLKDIMSVYDRK